MKTYQRYLSPFVCEFYTSLPQLLEVGKSWECGITNKQKKGKEEGTEEGEG